MKLSSPFASLLCWLASLLALCVSARADEALIQAEVVVYGATPSGVMAAVAAARHGHTVALVDYNKHIGGVVSGGLVATDTGDLKTVGGLSKEFFQRIRQYYETRYGADSAQLKACHGGVTFEPHVAEEVFEAMVAEQPGITIYKAHRYRSATSEGNHVTGLVVDDLAKGTVRTFAGTVYVDASYEGDLMAGAHVPYRVGREGRAEFGEYLAGVNMGPEAGRGLGDHRTMSYNYRVSVTFDTANRVLFPKPANYDPEPFRQAEGKRALAGTLKGFGGLFTTIEKAGPNKKLDANWADFPGNSEGYAEGDWTTRERIAARERDYFQSRLYYLQNDPELPEGFRAEVQTWGLPKDEFADNGHWPFQLYVREARRMVGQYVITESDCTQDRWKADGIATGSYGIDCHTVQMLREEGRLVPEHTRHVALNNWDIPYRALVPPDVENLLVPVCCSATHVAYCSLRMEPVYMMLGHAAGDAAHLALAGKTSVAGVKPDELRALLRQEGSVLDAGYQPQGRLVCVPPHPQAGEKAVLKFLPRVLKDPVSEIAWDFEGDGQGTEKGERVVHAFALEKVYAVSAVLRDAAGRRRLLSLAVPVGAAAERDVTIDDFDAKLAGRWDGTFPDYLPGLPLRYSDIFLGPGIHKDSERKGSKAPARALFQPALAQTGRYQVCLGFRPTKGGATNTPVTIRHAGGTAKVVVNQREGKGSFNFTPLGEYKFTAGSRGSVEVRNTDTDGAVVIDGVRFVWLGE